MFSYTLHVIHVLKIPNHELFLLHLQLLEKERTPISVYQWSVNSEITGLIND